MRAIRAAPDDDAPRLACAEWLRGQDDPRGELIEIDGGPARLAAGEARREPPAASPGTTGTEAWLAPLRELGTDDLDARRGFVESAWLGSGDLQQLRDRGGPRGDAAGATPGSTEDDAEVERDAEVEDEADELEGEADELGRDGLDARRGFLESAWLVGGDVTRAGARGPRGPAARRAALLDQARWLAPVRALGARDLVVRRGFVESAQLVGRDVANAAALCRLEPILELRLTSGGRRPLAAAAAAAELSALRALSLDGRHADGIEAVLASPFLTGLRSLGIRAPVTPAIADAMARGGARPTRLSAAIVDGASAARLADSAFLTRLEVLHLMRPTDHVLTELGRAPLKSLRSLDLWEAAVSAAGFAALGDRLDRLDSLSFTGAALDHGAVQVWIARMVSGRLRRLAVSGAPCDALADLVASPVMAGIEDLDLAYGSFTPAVAAALRASPHRGRLRRLSIPGGDRATRGFSLPGVDVNDEGY